MNIEFPIRRILAKFLPANRNDSIDERYDKKSPFSPSILTKQEIDFNVAMCIIEVP